MIDKDIQIISEKLESLHSKILKSKFAETLTESEAVSLILAVGTINRYQAEIERLKKDNEYILMQHKFQRRPDGDCWNDVIEKAKAEAIKEFAERLLDKYEVWTDSDEREFQYVVELVEELKKELIGD